MTITGTGFLTGATVKLGGTSATGVSVSNSTTITATTAAHAAGAVDVVVTNTDAQNGTLSQGYTYTTPVNPAPTVSSISPVSGTTAGGTPVTITGTGFLAGATVSFGGTSATGVGVTQQHDHHGDDTGACGGGGERGGDQHGRAERDAEQRVHVHDRRRGRKHRVCAVEFRAGDDPGLEHDGGGDVSGGADGGRYEHRGHWLGRYQLRRSVRWQTTS